MRIGVLALQGDVREHLAALAESDVLARPIRRPEELAEVEALVIPGGESTAISNLAVSFGLLDPIRKRIADGMPVYGSCAGMIMLATTVLDGRPDQESLHGIEMTVRRNAFAGAGEPGGPSLAALWEMPQLATDALLLRRGRPGRGRQRTSVVKSVRLPEALWKDLERAARARRLNLHQAMRAALLGWIERSG